MKIQNIIIILFIITSCGKPVNKGNFNDEAWRADALACKDERKKLLQEFEKIKNNLRGISEKELQKLLGKPEATSLTDQSERMYIYYIEPGIQCEQKTRYSGSNKLLVRISSLGWVTEFSYENPIPLN